MQLTLPVQDTISPWNRTLCRALVESGQFSSIETENMPMRTIGRRWRHYHQFKLDGVPFALDTWDGDSTLINMRAEGVIDDVRAIVKISAGLNSELHKQITAETGIPIIPWIMFPDGLFPLASFQWEPRTKAYQGCLAGSMRRGGRKRWASYADTIGGYYTAPRLPMEEYVKLLQSCRWGIALAGVSDKTRREPEYISCGMPLALAYEPNYPFPFKAGVHYHRLHEPSDLDALPDINPKPFAAYSEWLWHTYFKPRAAAKLLLNLLAPYL